MTQSYPNTATGSTASDKTKTLLPKTRTLLRL